MAIMQGPLSKWTNVMNGWQYRWFVLDENSGLLSYYTSKEKMMRGVRRGCVRLRRAVIGIDDEDDSTFTITVDQKTFHFQARDSEEKEKWIEGLERTILRHSQPVRRWDSKPALTINDFDRKLSETDAYLQILIDQVKALEVRIGQSPDGPSKDKYNMVKTTAETMIESIKQSIVLMQISKQNVTSDSPLISGPAFEGHQGVRHVVNGDDGKIGNQLHLQQQLLSKSSDALVTPSGGENVAQESSMVNGELTGSTSMPNLFSPSEERTDFPGANSKIGESDELEEGVDVGGQLVNPVTRPLAMTGPVTMNPCLPSYVVPPVRPAASQIVPDTSYSSSEDEEDFFDAEDNSQETGDDEKVAPPVIASEDDVFDELYDDQNDDGLDSLDQHGSIITHLLSQVRIGMDLTKIVLPTFILERRSLLEMYADFLAHPDLFSAVADQKTPQDRMIQVLRWYLSAFHAGRRSSVAKKPYNPILGETFLCYYDLPNEEVDRVKVDDGPVPWADRSNVSFIAEQVSHHPPISAFYAENYKKRISVDGYIWTKSKFLGLSIGVHMIGQANLSVLDHDEHYIVTFPNGYGRSILTVPWIELGGKVEIKCAKTGYTGNVDFHTKPFYGGKKDRVTAEVYAPNDKKPVVTVQGEWNGVMYAKYATGATEVFVDTKTMPIIKKRVKTIDQQAANESRRLWQDVTYHLKQKDVETATSYKHKLEQIQREEAKERKEHGLKWETKLFQEVGEHWVYYRPLVNRLGSSS